ncbi:MAG: ATP-binding cassette domain-containing protein [Clostridia bacterium]|nr:ATP-binding cassette domain-containing protein [Clostridia bacterium]
MVEIKNLVKKYGNKYALDDISFTINSGEIVGFLGPNGAGKSTTMNIVTGYLASTSGTVVVDGKDILENALEAKKLIGYLPEQPPLYVDMTVQEYLDFVFELKGCTLNKAKHIDEICTITKITSVRERLIKNLSKGYKQRVGIAQALIGNPPIVIFDEPTVGLDPKQIIEVRNLIRNLGKTHTVILSTHILSEVQSVCNRIVVINNGKIVADEKTENLTKTITENLRYRVKVSGPQREVTQALRTVPGIVNVEALNERDADAFVYIVEGAPNVDIRKKLFRTLAAKDWPMLGLEAVGTDLEDIFIRLTDKTGKKKGE